MSIALAIPFSRPGPQWAQDRILLAENEAALWAPLETPAAGDAEGVIHASPG